MMSLAKQPKGKTCKVCKAEFIPARPLQSVCSPACGLAKATQDRVKVERKNATQARQERSKARLKLKSRGQWLKETQALHNAYIRKRDEGLPCISCGSFTGKSNCGHYRSVGSAPELRFETLNSARQCEKCNSYLSGNLINYRINLIKRIGLDKVEWIESKHDAKHYSIEDLKLIKKQYKDKLKMPSNN
jgi:hypothetical protein